MFETWKKATDNNNSLGALLNDLLKPFDCLSHNLLIPKLKAHGLDLASLNILQVYFTNLKAKNKRGVDNSGQ